MLIEEAERCGYSVGLALRGRKLAVKPRRAGMQAPQGKWVVGIIDCHPEGRIKGLPWILFRE